MERRYESLRNNIIQRSNSLLLKILWLAHRDPLNPKAGGAERTIYEVCIRLVEKGHKILILTGGWRGCKAKDNLDGIAIYRYGKSLSPHLALPIFLLKTKVDMVVNDLGHAVPWVLSTIIGKNNIVFFRHRSIDSGSPLVMGSTSLSRSAFRL